MHMTIKINWLVALAVLHAHLYSCDMVELVVLCLIG